MQSRKTNRGYVLRLNKGEEIMETLTRFCVDNKIGSGLFSGIGAVLNAQIGFYHLDKKEYSFKTFEKPLEIISLIGNVSLVDHEPFLHVHVVLSDENYRAYGGHLKEAQVGATCEVYFFETEININRKLDEDIGLKLLDLEGDQST